MSPFLGVDYVLLKLGPSGVPLARAASLFKRQVVGMIVKLVPNAEWLAKP
jgi:hypothetical protein